uniref:Reverse transcriptase domain-containing protein n=1 Tax=Lygus hesperus TaxID=30085 RepID=A0A146LT49_LYGHE
MYNGYKCAVNHDGRLTEKIATNVGVRQGCLLSPILFLILLEKVLKNMNRRRRRGIQWGLTGRLEDLEYADDLCLLAHRLSDIQGLVRDLGNAGEREGLVINQSKSFEMRVNAPRPTPLMLCGVPIAQADQITYLGSVVSGDGGSDLDVQARINKA